MRDNFAPGWVSRLNKLMSKWVNELTCTGHMYVPRKLCPLGNKYHKIPG